MIPIQTLASVMLAAFAAGGPERGMASAGPVTPAPAASSLNDATVVALSLVPRSGRADVVVRLEGAVTLKHFTLAKPDKIVVDLTGATLGLPDGDAYDGVARGGITRIRYSQFTKTVVRLVLTLDAPHSYGVVQTNGEVRVSVDAVQDKFEPWQVGEEKAATPAGAELRDVPSAIAPTKAVRTEQPHTKAGSSLAAERLSQNDGESVGLALNAPKRQQQSQQPRITVNFPEGTSINDVISLFSAYSGRTILASRNVTGTVTASIVDQPWDVALKEIMNANGYDVSLNPDGIIVVDTFEAIAARQAVNQATAVLQTATLRLNYSRAISVAPMVTARLSRTCPQNAASAATASGQGVAAPGAPATGGQPAPGQTAIQSFACPTRGTVTADTITNSISITDVVTNLPELLRYARSLDLRQPQVNIKAKIILVDRSTLEGLGLRYDIGTNKQFFNDIVPRLDSTGKPLTTPGQISLGGNAVSAIANATARVPSAALQLVYSTAMGGYDFSTFLEALQTNTLLDVQAEPSATVLNNRTANLTAGTQVPIRVIDAGAGANSTGNFPRAQVQMQQTGVILNVTPQITANHQVQMKVHVENSDVQFQASDVGAVFPTQKSETEMLVADGETMVVGGLTQTTVNYSRSGIPLLIDLPIIGRFFGVTNRQETKRDLLILITPHITDVGQEPPPDGGRP